MIGPILFLNPATLGCHIYQTNIGGEHFFVGGRSEISEEIQNLDRFRCGVNTALGA